MAALRQLFNYLEQGYTIRGGPNFTEKIVPQTRKDDLQVVTHYKQVDFDEWEKLEVYALATILQWHSTWEWGVVVGDALLTNLAEIATAIAARPSS